MINRKDNGQAYTCKASNSATGDQALSSSVPLKVLFKPAFVKITVEPEEPKAGQKAIMTCQSGSSNPTSRIVWRYKNKHYDGVDSSVVAGDYGGNVTTNMLEIEIKPEDHGAIIICEAINDELQESVLNAKTLSVKCKQSLLIFHSLQAKQKKALRVLKKTRMKKFNMVLLSF